MRESAGVRVVLCLCVALSAGWFVGLGCGGGDSTDEQIEETSVREKVGGEGGTVQLGNQVTMNVPSGAVSGEKELTVSVAKQDPPSELESVDGKLYNFGPEGTTFEKPVEVSLRFDGSASGDVVIYWTKMGSNTFEPKTTTVRDGMASTTVTHFSQGTVGKVQSCQSSSDCPAEIQCRHGKCYQPDCGNGRKDGYETDVDCGGPACGGCTAGDSCNRDTDCTSGACAAGQCDSGIATDGISDTGAEGAGETDVPVNCDPGQTQCRQQCVDLSTSPSHCGSCFNSCVGSEVCEMGTCAQPHCFDSMKSTGETDVDCGDTCPPCASGEDCVQDSDCQSGVCTSGTCAAPGCSDGVQNGDETDVDCGGSCGGCADGNDCSSDGDCTSGVCDNGTCQHAGSCATGQTKCDGVCVDTDTNTDHCGQCFNACAATGSPDGGSSSVICNQGECGEMHCFDQTQSGDETDIDCGGSCDGCEPGESCQSDADCQSDVCMSGMCAAPSCSDGIENGDESDVDCGGSSCSGCANSLDCNVDTDCASGYCNSGTCYHVGSCPTGETKCDGKCVDTDTNANHCGQCFNACMATDAGTGGCSGGTCN